MARFSFWTFLVVLIVIRYLSAQPHYPEGTRLKITTRVSQEPIRYSFKQSLSLLGLKVYLPLYPEISYGDQVVIIGEVKGKELVNANLVSVTESKNWLFKFRKRIIEFYRACLPEPHASLVAGIVLGSKSQIPVDFWQALKDKGVAHVVVASGMNVAFVASFLLSFLALFGPRRRILPLVLIGIWIYALLAGFEAPIIRAAVMVSLALGAQSSGRLATVWRIWIISALGMLIFNPLWLKDTGFWLTFVATGSLILFEKPIRRSLKVVPAILREGFSTTLAAQIGVTPILFVTFGQFNIWSPLVNLAVLWTVPLIMIIGTVAGVIGLLIPGLARLTLYLCYPLTWWFIAVVKL